jgi:hypothetical protein
MTCMQIRQAITARLDGESLHRAIRLSPAPPMPDRTRQVLGAIAVIRAPRLA